MSTFIIDCPECRAKVAAEEKGRASSSGQEPESGEPYGYAIYLGRCPSCGVLLVGESHQVDFAGIDAEDDRWSDVVRVYPRPKKAFSSFNIPKVVKDSLSEADRCMQVESYTAACAMIGRAIEAVCRHALHPEDFEYQPAGAPPKQKNKVMLAEGIRRLKEAGVIDDRLHEWGTELHAFRNLAAHPDDFAITREDAEDLQNFANAIVEYIYDLAERYREFKARKAKRES